MNEGLFVPLLIAALFGVLGVSEMLDALRYVRDNERASVVDIVLRFVVAAGLLSMGALVLGAASSGR